MTKLTAFDKLNILFKSRVIKEMTIEDLEFWKGFEKIYPSYIRFPETIEFNQHGNEWYANRTKELRDLKKLLKNVDKMINDLFRSPKLKTKPLCAKRSKEVEDYLSKEKERLDKHLNKLKELKQKLGEVSDG
jgi:hypothetical protein